MTRDDSTGGSRYLLTPSRWRGTSPPPCAPRLAIVASSASGDPVRRIRLRAPGSPLRKTPTAAPTKPLVAVMRCAIGADNDPSASGRDKQSGFMEILASTPIGYPESDAERRIREAAEWVVDITEARAQHDSKGKSLFWCFA
uniref:Uncharacterized protein n=2 Tax=Avena sativa TaxID=4498 RepID=A0ACD5Y3G4_AVESA